MSPATIGLLGIVVLLLSLLFLRLPVGFAMALIGFLGFWKIINLQAAPGHARDRGLERVLVLRPHRDPPVHPHGADLFLCGR